MCIYILSRLQSPAFIHFKVQFFAVSHGSQYWTTPDIMHTSLMKETKMAISRKKKKKTVIWGEVRQLFFTLNTEKIRGKHNRVEWPGSRVVVTVIHWSQSVMNLPHAILFSNTYWILFWKKERIMVYSRIARKKINNTLNSQCAIPMKIKLIHGLHGCEPNLGPPGKK